MTRVMHWEDPTGIVHKPFDMHAWRAVCQFKVDALNFRLCFIFYKTLTRLVYYQHSIHLQNFFTLNLIWFVPKYWLLSINFNVANGYHWDLIELHYSLNGSVNTSILKLEVEQNFPLVSNFRQYIKAANLKWLLLCAVFILMLCIMVLNTGDLNSIIMCEIFSSFSAPTVKSRTTNFCAYRIIALIVFTPCHYKTIVLVVITQLLVTQNNKNAPDAVIPMFMIINCCIKTINLHRKYCKTT